MRRMITDKQLDELNSKNLKIIELDTGISQATITQEQMDIFFPKDAQGNIYKPDYYIVISDTLSPSGNGGFNYLGFWSPTSIRFNRLGTNGYYTWTIGPNDTKFTQTNTKVPTLYQHNIYIKTNELYIFLTIFTTSAYNFTNIEALPDLSKHRSCSGYVHTGNPGPITSLYQTPDNKYYFSVSENKDYAFFEANDVIEFTDEVTFIS